MASGLLPLCFGEATKFLADLLAADKTYEAELSFGVTTDTGDAEGRIVRRRPVDFGRVDLVAALTEFRGPIWQTPPMYSALKKDGKPLYALAREGIRVDRARRQVTIHELTLLDFSDDRCRLRVVCSKGTYIRTLAEDLGDRLACGAHLTALRRTAAGSLTVDQASTLEQLAARDESARCEWLLPTDTLLQNLPAVDLDAESGRRFLHGGNVCASTTPGRCRVYAQSRLLGLGEVDERGVLQPRRVISS